MAKIAFVVDSLDPNKSPKHQYLFEHVNLAADLNHEIIVITSFAPETEEYEFRRHNITIYRPFKKWSLKELLYSSRFLWSLKVDIFHFLLAVNMNQPGFMPAGFFKLALFCKSVGKATICCSLLCDHPEKMAASEVRKFKELFVLVFLPGTESTLTDLSFEFANLPLPPILNQVPSLTNYRTSDKFCNKAQGGSCARYRDDEVTKLQNLSEDLYIEGGFSSKTMIVVPLEIANLKNIEDLSRSLAHIMQSSDSPCFVFPFGWGNLSKLSQNYIYTLWSKLNLSSNFLILDDLDSSELARLFSEARLVVTAPIPSNIDALYWAYFAKSFGVPALLSQQQVKKDNFEWLKNDNCLVCADKEASLFEQCCVFLNSPELQQKIKSELQISLSFEHHDQWSNLLNRQYSKLLS